MLDLDALRLGGEEDGVNELRAVALYVQGSNVLESITAGDDDWLDVRIIPHKLLLEDRLDEGVALPGVFCEVIRGDVAAEEFVDLLLEALEEVVAEFVEGHKLAEEEGGALEDELGEGGQVVLALVFVGEEVLLHLALDIGDGDVLGECSNTFKMMLS